ncbi:HlyD family efflux transporter periplasmic adaptor subunit [Haliangium ochraceum]|uniref:Uncharacterized protein n=1 Tax=Haliangium ochraceum (strain DSM 14365 / JCM 11303 / SMP-2) TaxID=502025 RepID=D0LIF8_HALO1|nr:HlyD family efflux transporter periplasmic adaptor subunit [Haliangium ochraceum]ACY18314.1 hypothetical protein Hoch_5838 [Haliangium ochraceum DSM 14365]
MRVALASHGEVDADARRWLEAQLAGPVHGELSTLDSGAAVLDALRAAETGARPSFDVLVLGHALRDMKPAALLAAITELREAQLEAAESAGVAPVAPVPVFLLRPAAGEVPAGEVPAGEVPECVYHLLHDGLGAAEVAALMRSACRREPLAPSRTPRDKSDIPPQASLQVTRNLAAQRKLEDAAEVCVRAMNLLVSCERAQCLFFDDSGGALWSELLDQPYEGYAHAGLAGFTARTAEPLHLRRADADPRYQGDMDDPHGDGGAQLLTQPVIGADGAVHAVLVAARDADARPFTAIHRANLATLAAHFAPLFDLLGAHLEARAETKGDDGPLFREEALEAYSESDEHGDVLRISPGWVGWTFWLLLFACVSALLYAALGTVSEYSSGPALVRMNGRTELTASRPGTIEEIYVVPGQRVRAGQVLVRLHDIDALVEYQRINDDFEAQLRNLLRTPSDLGLRQAVAGLRAQREQALALLEERRIRAPHAGTVSDVRIRPGLALATGELLLSLIDDESDLTVVALLPGGDRPLLAPGMTLRLELSGYQYAYQDLHLETVADEVIGPTEAVRYLGPQAADALSITGPVVLVGARLPSTTFTTDDGVFNYHDGMQGIAEVRVRDRTILEHLFPALRRLSEW